jgi:hypothetical protein
MARAIDWSHYDRLKAQGLADREIARRWEIPWSTFHRETKKRESLPAHEPTAVHRGTPTRQQRHTRAHLGTPGTHPTRVHRGTPAQQPTQAHPGVPMPNDLAARLLSLLPDLEAMVTRERDRQRLLSTPIGTPRHTVKKTYVVDTLYVDLIERYAGTEGLELKDVVNLALHEFFERRHYLPEEA